jgi:hypothetical protein
VAHDFRLEDVWALRSGPQRLSPPGGAHRALPAEIANRTVHGILHIGRVRDDAGDFRAQMATLVKPNGLVGDAYMAAIKPFRHWVVYPALLRSMEQACA